MEARTIGGFIAVLRKASGMTQRELAEKLNVSDKTVSRWERDESAPDLATIPVLAEIFGVSCDELLRGQRLKEEQRTQPEQPTAQGEKQRQRLMAVSLSRYRSWSMLSLGLLLAGLLGAMICNYAFLRSTLGFFVGAVFFGAGAICQGVAVNSAMLRICDGALSEEQRGAYKLTVARLAMWVFSAALVLLAVCFPLLVWGDPYAGLSGSAWLVDGLLLGAIVAAACVGLCWAVDARLMSRTAGISQEAAKKNQNRLLLGKIALCLVAALAVTGMTLGFLAEGLQRKGEVDNALEFTSYEAFQEYMQQPVRFQHGAGWIAAPEESDDTQEESYDDLCLADGKVVCTFQWRNEGVAWYEISDRADGLPIRVFTYAGNERVQQKAAPLLTLIFCLLFAGEIVGAAAVYRKKRQK